MSQDSLLLLVQVSLGELPERGLVGLVRVPEERLEVLLHAEDKETTVNACSILSSSEGGKTAHMEIELPDWVVVEVLLVDVVVFIVLGRHVLRKSAAGEHICRFTDGF